MKKAGENFDLSTLKKGTKIICINFSRMWKDILTKNKIYTLLNDGDSDWLYIKDDTGIGRNRYLWNSMEDARFVLWNENSNEEFE